MNTDKTLLCLSVFICVHLWPNAFLGGVKGVIRLQNRGNYETKTSSSCDCGFGRIDLGGAGQEGGRRSASRDEGRNRDVGRTGGHHRCQAGCALVHYFGGGRRGQQA